MNREGALRHAAGTAQTSSGTASQRDSHTPQRLRDIVAISDAVTYREPRYRRYATHHIWLHLLARLVAGASPWETAYWLQESVSPADKVFGSKHVSAAALGKRLARIQRSLPMTAVLPPSVVHTLLREAEEQIDVLRQLVALCRLQRWRIECLHQREQELGLPLEHQRREIQAYSRTLMQIFAVQLALGIGPGNGPSVTDRVASSRPEHQRAG